LSESEPIIDLRPVLAGRSQRSANAGASAASTASANTHSRDTPAVTTFNRLELNEILRLYGRFVASGEWRDYAIDMGRETAVFSIFRATKRRTENSNKIFGETNGQDSEN